MVFLNTLWWTAIPAGEFCPEKIEDSFVDFSDSEESFSKEITEFSGVPESILLAWWPAGTAVWWRPLC